LVFVWHFILVRDGHLAPPPIFPLSIFTEGHTGVALFMTLSGYLFAKLLDGKDINYLSFFCNRALRLLPLLSLVLLIIGIRDYFGGGHHFLYLRKVLAGILLPVLPNGGWSVTVEFHFYLALPLLLFLSKRVKYSLFAIVVLAVVLRCLFYLQTGEIQELSYYTILGRVDQFILGICAFQYRVWFKKQHLLAGIIFSVFMSFYWYFDSLGGFSGNSGYLSTNPIWIYLTTMEGLAYAALIAWYDNSFEHKPGLVSSFIARIGTYSYSIYLLHFFFYEPLSSGIDKYVIELSNIYVALFFALLAFLIMVPIGYLSYRFIESPFLAYRTTYIRNKIYY